MRISDWSSDVCSSDRRSARLVAAVGANAVQAYGKGAIVGEDGELEHGAVWHEAGGWALREALGDPKAIVPSSKTVASLGCRLMIPLGHIRASYVRSHFRSEEHTSELQSLMRISYAVFCLKKKISIDIHSYTHIPSYTF